MAPEDHELHDRDADMGSRAMCLLLVGALLSLAVVRYAGATPPEAACGSAALRGVGTVAHAVAQRDAACEQPPPAR